MPKTVTGSKSKPRANKHDYWHNKRMTVKELASRRLGTRYEFSLSSLLQATWYLEKKRFNIDDAQWRRLYLPEDRWLEPARTTADAVAANRSQLVRFVRDVLDEFDVTPEPNFVLAAIIMTYATTLRMFEVRQLTPQILRDIRDGKPTDGIRFKKKPNRVALRILYARDVLTPSRFEKIEKLLETKRLYSRQSITAYMRQKGIKGGLQVIRGLAITSFLQNGMSREQVRLIARHKNVETLKNYNMGLDTSKYLADIFHSRFASS